MVYSIARSRYGLTSRWSVTHNSGTSFSVAQRKWFGPHKGKYSLVASYDEDYGEYFVSLFKEDDKLISFVYSFATGSVSNFP